MRRWVWNLVVVVRHKQAVGRGQARGRGQGVRAKAGQLFPMDGVVLERVVRRVHLRNAVALGA